MIDKKEEKPEGYFDGLEGDSDNETSSWTKLQRFLLDNLES